MMLWLAIVANLVAIATIPFWARLSDRVGRKPVFVTGARSAAPCWSRPSSARSPPATAPLVFVTAACSWPASSTACPTRCGRRRTRSTSRPASGSPAWRSAPSSASRWPASRPTIAGALMGGDADNWYTVAAFAVGACVDLRDRRAAPARAAPTVLPTREVGAAQPSAARARGPTRRLTPSAEPTGRRTCSAWSAPGSRASLTPAMQEREGRRAGLSPDLPARSTPTCAGSGSTTCPTLLRLGAAARASTASTSPTRSSRPWSRCSTSSPRTPPTWARSTPWSSGTAGCSATTPTGPATAGRSGRCCPDAVRDRVRAASAPAAPGWRSATALLRAGRRARRGARRRPGPRATPAWCGWPSASATTGSPSRRRPGAGARRRAAAWSTRRRSGCSATRACRCPAQLVRDRTCGSPTSSTSRSRPSWSRWPARAAAGSCPAAAWPCTRRSAPSSTSPAGSADAAPDGAGTSRTPLTGG